MTDPGVTDALKDEIAEVRSAATDVENAVEQDLTYNTLAETLHASGRLAEAAEKLRDAAGRQLNRLED